jgi:hypothetical protein
VASSRDLGPRLDRTEHRLRLQGALASPFLALYPAAVDEFRASLATEQARAVKRVEVFRNTGQSG